jgi:hypothetical protein
MLACSPLLGFVLALFMHLHFFVQDATISGDATCATADACIVSLLMGELYMHTSMISTDSIRAGPFHVLAFPRAESKDLRRRHLLL